ncbi:MAG: SDR family NAD(P)-dependent oxidoreductase, partial [Calditrichaeota bacterium]
MTGDSNLHDSANSIAVIGMAGRFPQSRDLEEFWQNLRNGVEMITFLSEEDLKAEGIDPSVYNNPNYVKSAGGVLEDVEMFDAAFFDYTPREAEVMDPQHRLFLECAWEAFENAGYNPEKYPGAISVFASASMNSYLLNYLMTNKSLLESLGGFNIMVSNDKDFLTTRISYKFNLTGPSMVVQTACSSSLVALCQAVNSLLSYQCDMALTGGVSVGVPQKVGYFYQQGGIASPDGHCRAFDAKAAGTVGGNGVGIVVLKRLSDALEDGDTIYAIVKGAALNNDGSLKIGYTAPSVKGQAEVITMAQALAGVTADTIGYVETHGTGTQLGDPIEIEALTKAFRTTTDKKGFCAIGSVKTNMGHLDAAAGIAGFIKTVLVLKNKEIPPSLNFEKPNPKIDFENSPFYVNAKLSEFKQNGHPRRAGVSSFGIGGTNAHVILEEAPEVKPSGPSRSAQLLTLSAKTPSALDTMTDNLLRYFEQHQDVNIADAAFTLKVGRKAFKHRRMFVCADVKDAVEILKSGDSRRIFTSTVEQGNKAVTFMFPGQGSQYVGMGRGLYEGEPLFRRVVDECSEVLAGHLGVDLRELIYPEGGGEGEGEARLRETCYTQPVLFVLEYALARLWMSWGVKPQAMIGHSIGEYVAACLSGVFSLEDGLRLVALRGRLMHSLPGGVMVAVMSSVDGVVDLLGGELSLAAENAPGLCVVSGSEGAMEGFLEGLEGRGIRYRRLHTSHAFHSGMMEPILEEFGEALSGVRLSSPQIPFISNVTGDWIREEEAVDRGYWVRHIRETVRFSRGVRVLLEEPSRVFLEVGPGRTLSTLAGMCQTEMKRLHKNQAFNQWIVPSMRHPSDRQDDVKVILNALGQLWLAGVEIDWGEFYRHEKRHRVPLPTYPFERHRYWIEANSTKNSPAAKQSGSLQKKSDLAQWIYIPGWKRAVVAGSSKKIEGRRFLIFTNHCWISSELLNSLKEKGYELITVKQGKKFSKQSENFYRLNPEKLDDYIHLLKEIEIHKKPLTIVHLWNVDDEVTQKSRSKGDSNEIGFNSLFFLAQALGDTGFTSPINIEIISNGLHDVVGDELLQPEKALILGACRVIPLEFSGVQCRNIDIDFPEQKNDRTKLVSQIINEIHLKPSDDIVAYRRGHRWIQHFEPLNLESNGEISPKLREGGVYLITGGLGGIGLTLAEFLAQSVKAKLILVGRSELPPRKEWQQWLDKNETINPVMAQKVKKLQKLEELGAEVMVVKADVSDIKQMRIVVKRARERFGHIHGVIHSAGIAPGGMIQLKTLEAMSEVFAPKVKGAQVLQHLFKNGELDFMIFCSSLASVLGGIGQLDYCAANAYLDALAIQSTRNGCYTVSICWDTWQEVGMAVNTEVPDELKAQRMEALKKG